MSDFFSHKSRFCNKFTDLLLIISLKIQRYSAGLYLKQQYHQDLWTSSINHDNHCKPTFQT